MMFRSVLFFSFIILFSFSNAEDYEFSSISSLIEQEIGAMIIPEIYAKLGKDVAVLPMPGERAQIEAVAGRTDGEIMRIYTYGEENPNMIRVPTPYYYLETMGFIEDTGKIHIKTKDDLDQLRIVKVKGVKHTNNVTSHISKEFLQDMNTTEQLMKFLVAGRADVALTNTVDGLAEIERKGYVGLIPLERPLARLELYHYLHEKHKDLVPHVDKVIQEMKDSGELAQVILNAEAAVINSMQTVQSQ